MCSINIISNILYLLSVYILIYMEVSGTARNLLYATKVMITFVAYNYLKKVILLSNADFLTS